MQENQTPLTAAQPANKRTVWLDKYQIPVYTDLQRADEILYATDTQLLNKPKKNYFAMVDLGEPTEDVAQKKLADIPLRAVTAALPGTVAGWAVAKTQFGRGLLATGVDMGRQLGAAVLKEAGSWATLAGIDTDTRLKKDGFLPGGKKKTITDTPSLAAGIFPFDKDSQKRSGLVDVEYVKERLGALKQEQAKIDDFNAKVKTITDNFLRRTGLAKTQEDGFLYDFGSGASSFLFSIGMLALTRNPALVAPLFGLMEGQGSYEQAVEAGLEPEQAYLLGKSNAAWITATEMVGEGMLNKLLFTQGVLGKGAQRILKRAEGKSFKAQTLTAGILGAAQGGGIEGTQEALQNVGSDLIMNAGKAQDKNIKDILQDALYAGLLAFPLGGMAGGVGGAANFVRFTQNVKEKLLQIGIPESKAQKLAQETALEAVSGEFVDDTLKAASGEINSPLTAARDPQAFVRQLTEAQEREIDRNAWNVGKQVEEASLKAGQDETHAKANGTVAQALANGIYRLTKLTPKEQEHFKINILREGAPAILFQSAAMYKNKANSLVEFKDFAVNNKGNKQEDNKSFYRFTNKDGVQIDVPFERALHIKEKHHLTDQQLDVAEKELNNAEYAVLMPDVGEYQGKQVKIKVNTSLGKMGAVLEILPNGRVFLDTAFFDSDAHIDNWAKENHPNAPSKKPVFIGGGTISIADIMREIKGNKSGTFDSANPNIYLQEDITAVDLTAPFADIAKLPADQRAQQVESSLNALIGQAMDTATPPLQIQITADNKVHIKNSNVKLKNGKLKRHQTALTTLEKIVNVAQKTDRKGAVDASHNTSKKTLAHKANVEEYVYFQAPVKIGEDTFLVELAAERVKGQDKNLLDLYNVHVKRNPATAHLSTYGQGSSTNRITNNEEFVKAQESGKTNNPSELLQENLFNIQQNPEEITEIHNQQTGEAILLEMNPNLKPFKPVELRSDFLPMAQNTADGKKQLIDSVFGKKEQITIKKDGKIFLLSRSSVKKMQNTSITAAKDYANKHNLQTEERRQLYHDVGEQVAQALKVFETAQLILSHKDVKNVSGRIILRYGNIFNYRGKTYYAMFVSKQDGVLSDLHLYDLQAEQRENASGPSRAYPGHRLHIDNIEEKEAFVKENKYTAGNSGVINNPSQQRYTDSIDELVRFVKRKIAKYNNNVSGKGSGSSELLQENLFNIQQNPEEITEIHNQQTGEAIPLISHIAGREQETITPIVLNEIVANATTNKKTVRKVLLAGKTPRTLTSKLGKNYLLSTNSVDKMYSSIFEHLSGEDLQPKKEIILHLPEIFPQMDLILSHKDVRGISRDIERFAAVVRVKGQDYYVMVVGKNGRVGKVEIATLYDLQSQANKNAPTNIPGEPGHKGLIYSLGDLDKFVKRKIAKYNNYVSGKQKVFNQGKARGSVTLNERAHEAIIRVFNQADPSTVVHELAHIYLTMINQAARVSADPEFALFLKDLTAWLGEPGENGEYSRAQQETFARGFEGYLAEGKAPNKELEGVFAKFARWLAEVYEGVKDYLQISPEVRRVFDRLLAPEETISRSRVGDKIEAAKQLVEKIKRGQGPEIDGLTLADMKALLKTISTRKPKRPTNHLLKDLRRYGAEYANAGQIDKEAYKNVRVYDKKGGIDDRPDVWLQKMGYMDFEDTTPETLQAAYDLVQKALDGAEVYRLEDQVQAENAQAYEENLNTVLQVFPDIKTAKETLSAIATLEQNGYRAVDKKDLTDLTQLVNVLGRMAAKLESEEIKAKEGALGEKANKIEEDAKRLKKRLMDELDKRQLENKEPMKNLLRAAKSTEDIHLAATALLDQLEKAWENTNEGKAEKALLAAPNTNWDKVRVDLLKRFNEIIGQTGEEVKAAQKVLNDLNGRILSEPQAQAKEKAEAVLKKANLEGRYVRAMEDAVRGLPHIYPADVRKKIAVLARSQRRFRLLNDKSITDFIGDVKKIQEANYKKYMSGKLGQLFSRKVYEKVGSAKRSKYSLLAKQFIEDGAQIWHLSEADLQTRYKEVIEHLDPNNAPNPWTALLNSVLALRAAPSLVPMKRFAEIYETALSAVRGDAQAKRLEILIANTRESQLRLAAEVALKNRNLPAGTVAYLLRGGTDFQTMLSILFGKGKFDKYENSAKNIKENLREETRSHNPSVSKATNSIAHTEPVFKGAPTLEDYKNPSRDFVLPAVPAEITAQLGVENKPVLLKKNIIEKNKLHHKELPLEDYNGILERGLYTPNLVLQTNPQERPNYFNFIFEGKDKSDNVVVEIATGKDNAEVVSFYRLDKDKLDKKIKRTNRNGGQAVKTHMRGPSPIRTPSVDSTNSIANTEPVFKGGREQYEIDFRKELSPEGEQMQAAVFDFNAKKAIFKAALDAYGLETADHVLAKMYELQNDKIQITNYGWVKDEQEGGLVERIWQNGTAYTNNRPRVQTITREELITFWLWSQDHEIVEGKDGKAQDLGLCGRLLRAYGKDQLNAMLDKLSPQDKQYGRNLQKILADVHAMESEAHQRIYGFPLPQKENYFPSVTERITDAIDYKQQFIDNAKAPSFIKSRTLSKMPVQAICSPTQLVLTHMKRASEFIFEAEKYTRLRRIFLQSDMESTFLDKFGQSDGKKLFDKLKDLIAQQGPTAAKPSGELWAMSNKLLNGWVKSALGLKVMTGVKQFASCVSFAEVMPADKWLKYFAYGLAHPMETAQYMKAQSPYIEVRYETGGLNEAVARAMAQDELAPIKTKWNNLTNLLLLNTRMGDKASLIFGGYPYMRYLQEQGKSAQEAARLFELQAVRTLQSSLKANLSMGQANGDDMGARLFMLFKNQQLQYVRRLADVYVQYKNGEVPLTQLGKTALLYLAVNPLVYVMLGIGWPSADDDDREKDSFRLASAPVTQFFDAWPFGGGVAEFLLENTYNVIRGKKLTAASQLGLPMFQDFWRDINRAIKTVNQDDIPATEAVAAWLEFAKYFGVPFGTLTNMATGAKDLVTGHPVRGALKELGFSKNRAGKITGEKE